MCARMREVMRDIALVCGGEYTEIIMKVALSIFGTIILGAMLYAVAGIHAKNVALEKHLIDLKGQLAALEAENVQLEEDVSYYSHSENLEKEARARLNLKTPGETLVIIPNGTQESGGEATTTEKAGEGETFWEKVKKFFEAN